jgi:muconolactone D-isomerase
VPEFLVRVQVDLPPELPAERRQELIDAERVRGLELIEQGALRRIWRVPGRYASVALYEAADATELHALLTSLPLWPWMDMRVEPLAQHPLES